MVMLTSWRNWFAGGWWVGTSPTASIVFVDLSHVIVCEAIVVAKTLIFICLRNYCWSSVDAE